MPRRTCHTCSKLGNLLDVCDMCGNASHPRCFAGLLGCKRCAKDIFPAYDIRVQELFALTGHNNLIFDPFSFDNDLHNIGVADREEGGFEQQAWSACSNVLQQCKYCELSSITSTRSYELKVLSLNIRSIHSKISTIRDLELKHYSKFSVLCFNETWCSADTLPFGGTELELEGFHPPIIQRPSRTSGRGGGLCIYINTSLCSENDFHVMEISDNSDPAIGEFLFVEINRNGNKNIIIGNMYRSPSFPPGPFLDNLGQKLDVLKKHKNKNIVLVSDSNIDLLKHDSFEPANQLVDLYSEHGLIPVISRPTHITDHCTTLIDHIFVNNCDAVLKSGIIATDLSDHLAPYVSLVVDSVILNKINTNLVETDTENYRRMNEENLAKFKVKILETDWGFVTNSSNSADTKFESFESKYHEIYDDCFPITPKTKKKRKFDKPWLPPWLSEACDRKNKSYIEYVKCPTPINKAKYLKYKRFVAKHIRKAKRKYYESYFKRYSDDGRKQWSMINELLNRKPRRKNSISKLVHKDNTKTTTFTRPQDIANRFNDFFLISLSA
jgi:hypothetical protein